MGQGYGRISNRRRGSGAWQWMLIGFFPGLLCGGMVIFALSIGGLLDSLGFSATPTPRVVTTVIEVVQVHTPTTDPNLPTITPFIITATPDPEQDVSAGSVQVSAPTATPPAPVEATDVTDAATDDTGSTIVTLGDSTPISDATSVVPDTTTNADSPETDTGVSVPATDVPSSPGGTTSTEATVPEMLAGIISPLVTVPGGEFTMGTTPNEVLLAVDECVNRDDANCQASYGEDSHPSFRVNLDTYQMEVYEVSFTQYVAFLNYMRTQGMNHLTGCGGGLCIQTVNENATDAVITFDNANYNVPPGLAQYPVYSVTWEGAKTYCETIGRRLPTEAEWEYAARGGQQGLLYPWSNEWDFNRAKTSRPVGEEHPLQVDSYPSGVSPYGLFNMAGNIAEWVQDWYSETYYDEMANLPQPIENPQGPPLTLQKVVRGGSWNSVPFFSRTVHRQSYLPQPEQPGERFPRWIGFRCAADAPDAAAASADISPESLGVGLENDTTDAGSQPVLDPPSEATQPESDPETAADPG